MKLIYHADDLGLSQGTNQGILECVDQGCLDAVSILPNGYALEHALEAYHERPDLLLSVHLNFIEGPALMPNEVPFIVDKDGDFNLSFLQMLRLSNRIKGEERERIRQGITAEIKAQVLKIQKHLHPEAPLRIDSHQHTHMIPVIFEALMEVAREIHIDYLRIPNDRWFISGASSSMFMQSIGINQAKVKLLNRLTRINTPKLLPGITTNDFFAGVLFTGKMDYRTVRESLKQIEPLAGEKSVVEVLFHPGRTLPDEIGNWKKYPGLWKYYHSTDRDKEKQGLLSIHLKR